MSLIHWWPLNGNLNDQGTSAISLTNNGATVNSSGKLGSCYYFNSTILNSSALDLSSCSNGCSLAIWAKIPTSHSTWSQIFVLGTSGTSWNNIRVGIDINSSGIPYFNVSNGSSNTNINSGAAIKDGIWHHICGTYDGTNLKLYVDGALVKTGTTSYVPALSSAYIYIGGNAGGEKFIAGYLNDARIYDHALSQKEVKEISKGLVLHYNFEQNINILANVEPYPTFDTSSSSGGWGQWGSTGNQGYYAQNTDKKYIYPGFSNYSHKFGNSAGATNPYLLYHENIFDGGYRSFQAIIKSKNSEPITDSICFPAWNGQVDGSVPNSHWTSIESLGDGFYLCKVEGIKQKTSPSSTNDHLVGIYVTAGNEVYVTCCYLENNRTVCSDIFNQPTDNLVSDISVGGRVVRDNASSLHTSGSDGDTYFYVHFNKEMTFGKYYVITCDVSGFSSYTDYWDFPICAQSYADTLRLRNGFCYAIFEYKSSQWTDATKMILDDSGFTSGVRSRNIYITNIKVFELPRIIDNSGYGYNGNLYNNALSVSSSGGPGKLGLSLLETNQYIKTSNFSFLTTGTVIIWAKYPSSSAYPKMLLAEDTSTTYYFAAVNSGGGWYHNSAGSITAYRDGEVNNYPLLDDAWHCYAFTGVNLSTWPGNLNICYYGGSGAGSYTFHGIIGDIKIYNTTLSSADIVAEYNRKAAIDRSANLFTGNTIEASNTFKFLDLNSTNFPGASFIDNNIIQISGHWAGFQFANSLFTYGKYYHISFDAQLHSGTLINILGHSNNWSPVTWYLDGKKGDTSWGGAPAATTTSEEVLKDGKWHHFDIYTRYAAQNDSYGFWVQVNRTDTSGNATVWFTGLGIEEVDSTYNYGKTSIDKSNFVSTYEVIEGQSTAKLSKIGAVCINKLIEN